MELFLAGATRQLGQLMVRAVKDVEADVAFFDAFEAFVHVSLPHGEAVHDRTVLMLQKRS